MGESGEVPTPSSGPESASTQEKLSRSFQEACRLLSNYKTDIEEHWHKKDDNFFGRLLFELDRRTQYYFLKDNRERLDWEGLTDTNKRLKMPAFDRIVFNNLQVKGADGKTYNISPALSYSLTQDRVALEPGAATASITPEIALQAIRGQIATAEKKFDGIKPIRLKPHKIVDQPA